MTVFSYYIRATCCGVNVLFLGTRARTHTRACAHLICKCKSTRLKNVGYNFKVLHRRPVYTR